MVSEHIAISWLGKLLIRLHFVLESDQDLLKGVSWVPGVEHVELGDLNYSVILVYAWQVNLGSELDGWWLCWVVISASDVEHVNSIVKVRIWWPNDCSIPLSERLVVT